jgi:hypothetical protein
MCWLPVAAGNNMMNSTATSNNSYTHSCGSSCISSGNVLATAIAHHLISSGNIGPTDAAKLTVAHPRLRELAFIATGGHHSSP